MSLLSARATLVVALTVLAGPAALAAAEEAVDLEMVGRIRDEGLNRSKVMETARHLTDRIGARLTASPQARESAEWTRRQLADWGLAGARVESWGPFGMGWSYDHVSVRMVAPASWPMMAIPKAWTPGTDGPRRATVVRVKLESDADLDAQKGKLKDRIVLMSDKREIKDQDKPLVDRFDEPELTELARFEIEDAGPAASMRRRFPDGPVDREGSLKRARLQKRLRTFLKEEGVVATLEPSLRERGIVRVGGGGSREKGEEPGVPALVVAAEQYNRVARLVAADQPVEVEIDVRARFHEGDLMGQNVIAEIPGSVRGGEVVMLGAHLDSWHSGTGATDNGAGVAVAMEAMRILKTLGVTPRRTIRIGLWTGEEQGLLGSRAYVSQHFASRPDPTPEEKELPTYLRKVTGPLTLKPDHARLSAYFNLDNGTGRIRGIYTQQNVAAAPIFEAWLRPLADLGAHLVTNRDTSGTDHQSFDRAGLPGFQFIQDDVDYSTVTHHTNVDLFDRLAEEDLKQASVVMASFVYHAAMREGRFPRKPLPKDPPAEPSPSPTPAPEP